MNKPKIEKIVKICGICKEKFIGFEGVKYCSDKCRVIAWNRYIADYRREQRFKEKVAQKGQERLHFLVEQQEIFDDESQICGKCYICEEEKNLIAHHVKYNQTFKVTLCVSCHQFLHKALLRKKVRNINCGYY